MTDHDTSIITNFSLDTENADKNFEMARWYEKQGHTAPAHTYYLRAAERAENTSSGKILAYISLIHASSCYKSQGSRDGTEKVLLENALMLLPERPEAYYFLSLLYERRSDWQNMYIHSTFGIEKYNNANLIEIQWDRPIYFPGKYALIFQKSVAAWNWGQGLECRTLLHYLIDNHWQEMDQIHKEKVKANITSLGAWPGKENKVQFVKDYIFTDADESQENLISVIVQGTYKNYTDAAVKSYLNLPFVKEVIISCWEEDDNPDATILKNDKVKLIRNKRPSSPGTDNRNLQIVSSINGLRLAKTKVSVKIRSDQIYSEKSFSMLNEFYRANAKEHEIFVSGIYPSLLFHPGDHIFWGETKDLVRLFDIPLETNGLIDKVKVSKENLHKYYPYYIRTETYIGAHYLANFNDEINIMLLHPEKYLHDNCENWHKTHELSKTLTNKYFKSFPRTGVELFWAGKKINYPFEVQRKFFNHCWSEDGY